MSDILSQAEIEALLNSLSPEAEAEAPASQAGGGSMAGMGGGSAGSNATGGLGGRTALASRIGKKSAAAFEFYDFRRPDKFSKDQLRTLQMLHETFARLAGSSLSAYLRSAVNIDLISLEQVPYEEYLRSISQSVFTIMSLPPLTGQAVLEIEFGLVFSMIDRMLGGPGKAISRNVLTDIERPLVRQMIERMFMALKSAWEGVVVVNPSIEGMETSAQFVQIAPPSDIVVTILFEVRIGQHRSAMSLCIPYLVLKPITTKLSAQKWFVSASRRHSPAHRRQLTHQLQQTSIDAAVRLGQARLRVREFMALQKGDILRLDQRTNRDLTMTVGSVPKFTGRPALQGKKIVFTVNQEIAI